MTSRQDPINLANVGLILLLSFCIAIIIVGVLIMRTKFWHTKSGAHRVVGRLMVICGAMISLVTLMFLLLNITKL